MIFNILIIFVALCYVMFLVACTVYWKIIPDQSGRVLKNIDLSVAVIVAARNEADKIQSLLQALQMQNYPAEKFRVVVVDDHSDDDTFKIVNSFIAVNKFNNCICLSSPFTSKKNTLAFGIKNSVEEIIFTTDADTIMGNEWISSICEHFVDPSLKMICGPVFLHHGKNIFEIIQSIEYTGLTGISGSSIAAGHPMFCSGANLAFTREAYEAVNGYEDSGSVSGDDTQLMKKVDEKFRGSVSFLKDRRAIVSSTVHGDTLGFWHQRKRWASKIVSTLSVFTISIAIIAWLFHFLLLIQIFRSLLNVHFLLLLSLLAAKTLSELYFLRTTGNFFDQKIPFLLMLLVQPFYACYIFVTGITAPFSKYKWKERISR